MEMGKFDSLLKNAASKLIVEEYHPDPEVVSFRKKRCENCDHLKDGKCQLCNCFYDLKAESLTNRTNLGFGKIEITHCPIGRWGDQSIVNLYKNAKDGHS